jgi:hypothetical protein
MLGRLKALTQHGEIPFAHRGLSAKARNQRLLAVLSIIQIVDGALLGGHLGAQPTKLSFVSIGRLAHHVRCTLVRSTSRSCRIVPHHSPRCRCPHLK